MTAAYPLPMAAADLLPHRPPLLLIDRLCSWGDGAGIAEACLGPDCILADAAGTLGQVALVELMAQGYAAVKGYDDLVNGRPVQEGFLVGIRKLQITGRATTGQLLHIQIKTIGSFEGFSVIEGTVASGEEILAAGTLKLWLVNEAASGGRP